MSTRDHHDDVPAFIHPFGRPAATNKDFLSIVKGVGSQVMDSNGRWYLDGLASLWYCNVGHGRAELIDAATRQMTDLASFHSFDIFTNPQADALADRLRTIAPMADARVFFTNSGSEAVDTAIKFARSAHAAAGAPERTVIISRIPSYHGVTYGGMSATGLPLNHVGFGPLLGDVIQVPAHDLAALDEVLEIVGDRLAAIIAEPVIGAGGVYPAHDGYLQGLRERCDQHGGYLILDEVVTGFGRVGTWWAAEAFGVQPDLVTFAKAVTSGYVPLGGVLVGPSVHRILASDEKFIFRHGNTYAGHPTAAAVAVANLDVIESEGLLGRAEHIGERLASMLEALVDGTVITGVRGKGAIRALAIGAGLDAITYRNLLLDRGVILRAVGPSALAVCPPLVITDDELDQLDVALRRVFPTN
jgi:putrescine aminotransferase